MRPVKRSDRQARLHVAKFLQHIALTQAPLTGISHPTKNGFDASGYGRIVKISVKIE
jgi:hypothetical protein